VTSRGNVLAAVISWFGGCGGQSLVAGRVTHATLGTPVAGASVTAQGVPMGAGDASSGMASAGVEALTDPDGRYSLVLASGTYDIVAQKAGYAAAVVSDVAVLTGTTAVDLQLDSPVAVVRPGTLSAYLAPGGTMTLTLHVANAGGVDLSFEISAGLEAPWVSEVPVSGTVPGGAELDVAVVCTAVPPYSAAGSYTATLLLLPNDPERSSIPIAVRMVVGGKLIYLPLLYKRAP
jgi:hypothetical protein